MLAADCPLCHPQAETVLWRGTRCRVILVDDRDYPGFCRVVWNAHVKEMTDLGIGERKYVMAIVFVVEQVLRELLQPEKINLASLGNLVPHLHWHVIPRFTDDVNFPDPIWGARKREARPRAISREVLAERLRERLMTAG